MALTCNVIGSVISGNGKGIPGVLVFARPYIISAIDQQTSSIVSQDVIVACTDAQGMFTIQLLQNTEYMLSIPVVGFREKIVTPESTECNLVELLSAPISGGSTSSGGTNW